MYAVCVEYDEEYGGIVPCGNYGLQKLHNKTRRGWLNETQVMRNITTGSVFVVSDFTQKMCEMSATQLADYVSRNHICRL